MGPLQIVPRGLAAGDFNGDGKLDLADAPRNRSGLNFPLVSLGEGDGTFRQVPDVPPPSNVFVISDLVTADFDLDRKLDVAGNTESSGVAVFRGNGDGTLQLPVLTPLAGGRAGALSVADVNRDGRPDLVSGQFVLLGNGDGTFAARLAFEGMALATGDFNGDGKVDVLLLQPSNRLTVRLGRGDGTFDDSLEITSPFAVESVATGDFTGDGIADLAVEPAVAQNSLVKIAVLPGRRDGTFLEPSITSGVPGPIFATADFNRDGKADILAGNSILVSEGRGTFSGPVFLGVTGSVCSTSPTTLCGPQYMALISADFNGDSFPDIAAAYRFTSGTVAVGYGVHVVLNDSPGDGFLSPGVSSAISATPVAINSLVTAYGVTLAPRTEAAPPPWPTTLGGARIHLTYRRAIANDVVVDRLAPISYVSPTQINYQLVGDIDFMGEGSPVVFVAIERVGSPFVPKGLAVPVRSLAPGLFTLNAANLAAATALRVLSDGRRLPVEVARCAAGSCEAVPMNVTQGAVYLSLYGTGFTKAAPLETTCTAGGDPVEVSYVGPQGQYPGLDQINVLLPSSLAGRGDVAIECKFGPEASSNSVRIRVE